MGGLLGAIDLHLPFFAAGALALLNLLYGWFVLPESLPRRAAPRRSRGARRSIRSPRCRARPARRRRPAGRGGRLQRARAVHPLHDAGCSTRPSSSAGARSRTAGRCSRSAACRRWCRASCSAGCCKRFSPQRLAIVGLVSSTLAYAAWGAATAGLDDVRGDPRATSSASRSRRRSRASSPAPPTRRRRAARWARSARCTA